MLDGKQSGTLWVVATPIGNLQDASARMRATLENVACVAAEDTRHSGVLLAHFGIRAELVALHDHNEGAVLQPLLDRLLGGEDIALVSDAGTPLISDPGFRLVRAARLAGIRVSPVPGASAAVAALSVAGLPSDRFVFEGFLPAKGSGRKSRLEQLAGEQRTLVFYESCHRIDDMLGDACEVLGEARHAVMARELTKLHETVLDDSLGGLRDRVAADRNQRRGEMVVVIAGAEDRPDSAVEEGRRLYALLCEELPPSRAARLAAAWSGAPRKALYGDGG